jgi:hypothetical protein
MCRTTVNALRHDVDRPAANADPSRIGWLARIDIADRTGDRFAGELRRRHGGTAAGETI